MAPKSAARAPKSAAPAASVSSYYTSSGSGEEDVEVIPPQKKQKHAAAVAPKPSSKAPIEGDSSTGDYSSSDESASDSGAAAKPSPTAKSLASRPPAAAAAAPNKKKRKEAPPPPPEDNNENGGVDGHKLQPFQRLWSESDEMAVLRGMLKYKAKTGALPSSTDMSAFCDSIRKSITMDISVRQLADKIRRLRNKYGKDPLTASSSKPNDSAIHELSHKIWGASNDARSARKSRKGKEVEENGDSGKVKPRYTFLENAITRMGDCLPCSVTLEEVLDLADHSKLMTIEEKLKNLWKLQRKNQAREMEIDKETNMLLMEALEKMG